MKMLMSQSRNCQCVVLLCFVCVGGEMGLRGVTCFVNNVNKAAPA